MSDREAEAALGATAIMVSAVDVAAFASAAASTRPNKRHDIRFVRSIVIHGKWARPCSWLAHVSTSAQWV
jgi:hypothetical protein